MKYAMRLLVMVVLLAAGQVHSQSNVALMGIGGKLGIVDPDGRPGNAVLLAALADLGKISPRVALEANLEYWKKGKLRDIILGGTAKYLFSTSYERLGPFAGAGIAFHFFSGGGSADTEIGLHLAGGAYYEYSPEIKFLGELRYTLVDIQQFAIQAGVVVKLTR